ncbi:MAG: UDP-N-acetylmuramoyl-tripeptide--D-alanyl-D-alanine ligase [Saprospiraceae bacterium]|nr:UDP-N-acetylmuramoyl-tripeptide--D-alanyl-D-alanine ligase [Saprospiraceae bacterium]
MSIADLYDLFRAATGVCTDTRQIKDGNLFFALKGANFDGNRFAQQALDAGANYAVVDDAKWEGHAQMVVVSDVLSSLQDLATYHRQQFDIPLLAITGSNGKTTTKELISRVMESHYPVHYTQGNFNNHIGVPLTLLAMPLGTEMAVIEMGANHQKEIAALCQIARPTHGIITNIGKAHLEGFGGIEGVKKGKGELFDYLAQHRGLAFINRDEAHLSEMASDISVKLFYERKQSPGLFQFQLLDDENFLQLAFKDYDHKETVIRSQLTGAYNLHNIMAAVAIGVYFKVPADRIKSAVEGYIPQNNRSQLMEWQGNQVILDAYNANPSSMEHALRNLQRKPAADKLAILGDMLELGEVSPAEHLQIATLATEVSPNIILVGKEFKAAAEQLQLRHFDGALALRPWLHEQKLEGKLILIKGSRGIGLERILDKGN